MARYFLRFRHSDTGLFPSFSFFKKASDLSDQTPPAIGEVASGTYYFDYSPTFDIIFEADGGPSIPTEEVRYISDTLSPKDVFVDEPVSQVHDDVWNDTDDRAPGTKGDFVEQIGVPTDTSADPTLFGKTLLYKESIRGDTAGTSDGNDVEQVFDRIGAPVGADLSADIAGIQTKLGTPVTDVSADIAGIQTKLGTPVADVSADIAAIKAVVDTIDTETDPTAIANAVWDEVLTGHITANTGGDVLMRVFKILKNRTKIDTTLDTLTVYDDDGTTPLYVFDLKDASGAPSGETPFERVPA